MLDASTFSQTNAEIEWDGPVWTTYLDAKRLLPIGAREPLSTIPVRWLGSPQHPQPEPAWLERSFPDAEACVAGFHAAFQDYCDAGCGNDMREEILNTADPGERQAFQEHGWLPFAFVHEILLIPSLQLLCFECHCDIDFNLDEHGAVILRHAGDWHLRYAGDWMDEFFA